MRKLRAGWAGARGGTLMLGGVPVDRVTFKEALDAIEAMVESGQGGRVFTPNVDHVVTAQEDRRFRDIYQRASLRLADGVPLLWAARLLKAPLPEKISGSDLVWPLMERAGQRGWSVYLLGGCDGVAAAAAERFRRELGVNVVGVDEAFLSNAEDPAQRAPIIQRIKLARADLVLVAFGAPKQEVFADRAQRDLPTSVFVGVGATFDFISGRVRRAPRWMQRAGLEWLYRLSREPRRLWRRYLVRDPKFAWLVAQVTWARLRGDRTYLQPGTPPLLT